MKKAHVLIVVLLSLLVPLAQVYAADVTQKQGSERTWHSGANLINNAQVLSANVNLSTSPTPSDVGHLEADCLLDVPTFSVAPTAGTTVVVWFRISTDGGTTFPDGDATVTPTRVPDMVFPLRNVATRQVVYSRIDKMPLGVFRVLIRNEGTGATLNNTWTLKCRTRTLSIN